MLRCLRGVRMAHVCLMSLVLGACAEGPMPGSGRSPDELPFDDAEVPVDGGTSIDPPDVVEDAGVMEECPRVRVVTMGIDLNVRAYPALDAEVVTQIPEGSVVDVLSVTTGDVVQGSSVWYEVSTDEGAGFVTSHWVECADQEEMERTRGLIPFDGYRLPLGCGREARVSQGNNTSFSHQDRSRWAYDIALPRGTAIHAMAPGRVVNASSRTRPGDACYNGGGAECRNAANYVRIKHSDGTISAYWHINRALVARGDRVAQGDPIARSGNTGYSTGPHLHVVRERDCDSIACQSVRLRFLDVRGDGMPDSGQRVTSGNCPER